MSPLEYCHVLLTPFRNQCRPQKLTPEGLRLALELILLSNSCDLRVGFNSLCGYASVNHEHYHAYYLSHRLYIEHAELIKVPDMNDRCPWLQLKNPAYPPGLCIVLTDASEVSIISISDAVMMLSTYFQTNDVGHNVYITRGSSKNIKGHFDSIRIWIWARQSSFGTKECDAFNPALCELAGHFPIKSNYIFLETCDADLKICKLSKYFIIIKYPVFGFSWVFRGFSTVIFFNNVFLCNFRCGILRTNP